MSVLIYPDGKPIERDAFEDQAFVEGVQNAVAEYRARMGRFPRWLYLNRRVWEDRVGRYLAALDGSFLIGDYQLFVGDHPDFALDRFNLSYDELPPSEVVWQQTQQAWRERMEEA